MKTIQVDISKKLAPLFKSVRKAGRVIGEEASKVADTIRDIESGKLKIVASIKITKKK